MPVVLRKTENTNRLTGGEQMAKLTFAPFIQRHIPQPPQDLFGNTVREILEAYFEKHRFARFYIMDEHDYLRPRLAAFVDGAVVADRTDLADPVHARAHVYVQNMPLDTEYECL
jgi:hypothetical protein